MRTRTRTESKAGDLLDLSWDDLFQNNPVVTVDSSAPQTSPASPEASETPEASKSLEAPEVPETQAEPAVLSAQPEAAHTDTEAPAEPAVLSAQPEAAHDDMLELFDYKETPQEEAPQKTEPAPKEPPIQPEAPAVMAQFDITANPESIADVIALFKTRSRLSSKQLAEKVFIQPWYIECLEKRNYKKLIEDHGQEYHTILQNLKTLCRASRAEDTLFEKVRELLAAELKADGFDSSDIRPSSTRHVITDSGEFNRTFHRTFLDYLPHILVGVIAILAFIILITKVLPFLNGRTSAASEPPSLGPVIQPVQQPPFSLPIPE